MILKLIYASENNKVCMELRICDFCLPEEPSIRRLLFQNLVLEIAQKYIEALCFSRQARNSLKLEAKS